MSALWHPPETHKLGKLEPKRPHLMLHDYLDIERALPQAPVYIDQSMGGSIPLAMYLNDRYGDCTCAAIGNTLRVNSRGVKKITDQDVEQAYIAVTGQEGAAFDPSTGNNDNGCVELDVLDYWTKTGVGGDRLLGHAGVDMTSLDEVRATLWLFGSVYLGVQLAVEQQSQEVWDFVVSSQPGSWGGHAIPLVELDVSGQDVSGLVGTWGAYKKVTGNFLVKQADEGHAPITQEWADANQGNSLIDVQSLINDLKQLQQES